MRWTAPEATSVARQVLVVVEEVERMRVYPVGQEVTVQIELMHAPLAPRGANVHRFPRAPQLRTEPVSAVPAGGAERTIRSGVDFGADAREHGVSRGAGGGGTLPSDAGD